MNGLELQRQYLDNILVVDSNVIPLKIQVIQIKTTDGQHIIKIYTESNSIIELRCKDTSSLLFNTLFYWTNMITRYWINGNQLVLDENVFWQIYKDLPSGRRFLQGVGYSLEIDGIGYKFAPPDYYFQDKKSAVYAIFFKDELVYIGSSTRYINRWTEHIRGMSAEEPYYSMNLEMYNALTGHLEDIEFKVLYSEDEIRNIMSIKSKDYITLYALECIEEKCIKHYQPKYNKEGRLYPFKYRGTESYALKERAKQLDDILIFKNIEELNS